MSHIAASTEEEQLLLDIARCHLSLLAFVSAKGGWRNVALSPCCIFPAVHLSRCVTLHTHAIGLSAYRISVTYKPRCWVFLVSSILHNVSISRVLGMLSRKVLTTFPLKENCDFWRTLQNFSSYSHIPCDRKVHLWFFSQLLFLYRNLTD